jgi:nicotinamidase-related amidase
MMKPALLVIDAQQEYFAPHGKWVLPDGERALERIHALIAAAREAGIPIFYITHESLGDNPPVFRKGSAGVALHPSLAPASGEAVVNKHFPNAFAQTPLEAYLRQAGVDTLIISGYMTQMCCDTTTRAARERAFSVLFAADATAARDLTLNGVTVPHDRVHETTLAVMTQFASVLMTEEITAKLRAETSGAA